jgi:hypothetical protein
VLGADADITEGIELHWLGPWRLSCETVAETYHIAGIA